MRVSCAGGPQICAVHSWHSEGCTQTNGALTEAVLEAKAGIPYPKSVVGGGSVLLEVVAQVDWVRRQCCFASRGAAIYKTNVQG